MAALNSIKTKHLYILTCIIFLFHGCSSGNIPQTSDEKFCQRDTVARYALKYLGSPYKWAGASPEGFDCSGFVSYVYKKFDIELPRSSVGYFNIGTHVAIERCCRGDIILFSGRNKNLDTVGHVGIIISAPGEPLEFIHSSSSKTGGGIIVTKLSEYYYLSRFIGIRRI